MLAQQLTSMGCPGEVIYIDLSEASREIAEARAKARGLTNVRFVRMSLLDLPANDLGAFDYIDCCGVLHHLNEPQAGLEALVQVLADDGGLGLMVYGEFGRTGVYPMQDMMRSLVSDQSPAIRVEMTKRLLKQLPSTNWLRRNPFIADHLEQGDAGLFDLFLHARDRAYRVPEIIRMLNVAGLRPMTFIEPAFYDPASYLTDPSLLQPVEGLTWAERCAFAELLAGNMRKHILYVVKGQNPVSLPDPGNPQAVPILRELDGEEFARDFRPGSAITASNDRIAIRRPLPSLAGAILRRIDNQKTLEELHLDIAHANRDLELHAFAKSFASLFLALNGVGKMYLRMSPSARKG
jgi:SAM-dependent methyltransferase